MQGILLKRCPFCGAEADFAVSRDGVCVYCTECLVQTPRRIDYDVAGEGAVMDAVNVWNRRASDGEDEDE